MAAVKTVMVFLLAAACTCCALDVYNCYSNGKQRDPDEAVEIPCALSCCGTGRSHHLDPKVTFTVDRGRPLHSLYKNFSTPSCQYNTTTGFFICSTASVAGCRTNTYLCTVRQFMDSGSVTIPARPLEGDGEQPLGCEPPAITNITVVQQPNNKVLLKWNYTKRQGKRICTGTRRFRVKMKVYRNYGVAANDTVTSLISQDYGYTDVRRLVTNHTFSIVNPDLFFRFLVRARTIQKVQDRYIYTDPEYTAVQHFGPFDPLRWSPGCRDTYHVKEGEGITIPCTANGVPSPTVDYRKIGSSHKFSTPNFPVVSLGDNGTYTCEACHRVFHNHLGGFRKECRRTVINLIVIPRQRDRNCVSYTGLQCSEYIYNDMKVFTGNKSYTFTETRVSEFAYTYYDRFSEACRDFVKSALCHILLPYCNPFTEDVGQYSPLPMCPKTCAELEARCGAELRAHGGEFTRILADKCDPEAVTGGPGDVPGCIYIDSKNPLKGGLDTDSVPNDIASLECTISNGHTYRGRVKQTSSGLGCQRWSSQSPHQHQFTKMMVGELEGAGRYCRNPGGLGETPWCFVVDPSTGKRWEYCNIPACEECRRYTGEFCQSVGYTNTSSVLLRRQLKDSVSDMELELRGTLHKIHGALQLAGSELTPGCELVTHQLLCRGALPNCLDTTKVQVCEGFCHLLDVLVVCPSALREALYSITYIDVSVCEDRSLLLPPSHPSCIPLSLPATPEEKNGSLDEDCHNQTTLGHTYTGRVGVTQRGKKCVSWRDAPSARGLLKTSEMNHSFCRNPGQLGERPWCFTSTAGDWDFCNISICSGKSREALVSKKIKDHSSITAAITVVAIIIFAALLVVSGLVLYWQWRANQRRNKTDRSVAKLPDVTNQLYISDTGLCPKLIQRMGSFRKIEKGKIRYVREIGHGNFGTVFQGECDWIKRNNRDTEGETVKVAVKTHKNDSSDEAIKEFIKEAENLHRFSHPNIVEFYGVCTDELPFYMVFEYMDQGDLCQFLRERASSAQRRYNPPSETRPRVSSSSSIISSDSASLGTTDLLDICKQVASGMAYLESERYVHCDLAARNCLVSSGLVVKIADFGMSRNLYSKDYYRTQGETSLPVRWMPPEALVYGKFSTKTDVWAFGVVVWEVFSFGLQPYWGHTNEAVMDMVRKGILLEKPENCPDKLFTLVKGGCWGMYEHERMSFERLEKELRNFRLSDSNSSVSSMDGETDSVFESDLGLDDTDRD